MLGPECGWQPVSLTDLITSDSVRKVYRKASLCIHPDKIQQRGASIQQKYIAEKVFDVLKVCMHQNSASPPSYSINLNWDDNTIKYVMEYLFIE